MTTQKRNDARDEAYRRTSTARIARVGVRPREVESHWIDRPYRLERERAPEQEPEREPVPERAIASRPGPYRGKGPLNYRRTDERIRELVCEALAEDDEVDATQIEVSVSDGIVTLAGAVRDRPTKRMAEDVVDGIWGVRDVHNVLEIVLDRSL
jgi:hypothetical protein